MTTHTPGPWTVQITGMRGSFHIPEAQKHEASHSDDGVDGYTVSKANARLIAAAPELLDALQKLVADVLEYERANNLAPNPGRAYCWDSTEYAKEIIAKATND